MCFKVTPTRSRESSGYEVNSIDGHQPVKSCCFVFGWFSEIGSRRADSSARYGIHYAAQASLELVAILLLLPPGAGIIDASKVPSFRCGYSWRWVVCVGLLCQSLLHVLFFFF